MWSLGIILYILLTCAPSAQLCAASLCAAAAVRRSRPRGACLSVTAALPRGHGVPRPHAAPAALRAGGACRLTARTGRLLRGPSGRGSTAWTLRYAGLLCTLCAWGLLLSFPSSSTDEFAPNSTSAQLSNEHASCCACAFRCPGVWACVGGCQGPGAGTAAAGPIAAPHGAAGARPPAACLVRAACNAKALVCDVGDTDWRLLGC